ncbi:hypothetical protein [Sinisalibacter lacisalsi]|uniref:Uncharacterized protein n=1 Tax=Sinisalibacter lacisalsi TaxID=1526570 RepID=A0ABQ1QKZ0_9RHOB|nr:hypothetical protein [Sinisalibacter lacisalsi]GGD32179.1 hypothetical protein GCM10011358_15330 [Sinisalibacter lacisalsi]
MRIRPQQFLRMSRWARRPPSEKRVKLVLAVIAIALAIWGLERVFGSPEWMRIDSTPKGRINR